MALNDPHLDPSLGSRRRLGRAVLRACAAIACGAIPGCYNGDALVERARNDALRTRVETVDLGRFDITMPSSVGLHGMTEVQIEPFGRTVRYKLSDTEDLIEERRYALRHAVMLTVRSSELEDFADPNLKRLRDRLLVSVHEALGDDAIDSVGFNHVRFVRH